MNWLKKTWAKVSSFGKKLGQGLAEALWGTPQKLAATVLLVAVGIILSIAMPGIVIGALIIVAVYAIVALCAYVAINVVQGAGKGFREEQAEAEIKAEIKDRKAQAKAVRKQALNIASAEAEILSANVEVKDAARNLAVAASRGLIVDVK